MRINSVSRAESFGVKFPENFAQKMQKQCVGINLTDALNFMEHIKNTASDKITFTNIFSTNQKVSLLGKRRNIIKMSLEKVFDPENKRKASYTDFFEGKEALSVNKLIELAKEFIKKQ